MVKLKFCYFQHLHLLRSQDGVGQLLVVGPTTSCSPSLQRLATSASAQATRVAMNQSGATTTRITTAAAVHANPWSTSERQSLAVNGKGRAAWTLSSVSSPGPGFCSAVMASPIGNAHSLDKLIAKSEERESNQGPKLRTNLELPNLQKVCETTLPGLTHPESTFNIRIKGGAAPNVGQDRGNSGSEVVEETSFIVANKRSGELEPGLGGDLSIG